MSRLTGRSFVLLAVAMVSTAAAFADDKTAATSPAYDKPATDSKPVADSNAVADSKSTADKQAVLAILGLMHQVESDFNAGDAKALASCWTENGEFVGSAGARMEGRDTIEKQFQETFAARKDGAKLQFHLVHFRLANEALAFVEAVAEVKPAQVIGGTPVSNIVLVKQNDRWLIERAHESIAHLPPDANHLKELEWLVGDWSSDIAPNGLSLQSSCDWTANRGFLIRKFKVEGKQAFVHGGTEVIGWDPRSNRIRSWIFDSDGGFGENVWIRDGNRWLIKYCGTLADGSETSATQILSKVDAETATIQSKDRVVNGTTQPDVPETALKRLTVAKPAAKPEPYPRRIER
jgi:uncharacterized protein (TIGR02246 family)